MKHTVKIILILITLFLLAQIIGLFIINNYTIKGKKLPYNIEPPKFKEETSYLPIFVIILIATLLAFLLAKFKAVKLWKAWFFLSVWFCLIIALSVFVSQGIALLIALALAFFRILKPNIIIHNLTELFIYGGLAAIFVPILNIFSISILLLVISVYDMIAVWGTKHMIKLAKFQSKLKMFAGLLIPYDKKNVAVLGGGDIGFPLLFAGVVMKSFGLKALLIPLFCCIALTLLLIKGKKKKFYPAMPFLSIGCFVGFLVLILISKFI